MRFKTLLGVSLSLSAILTQAACSADSAATAGPVESTKTTSGEQRGGSASTVILPEGTSLAVQTGSALSTNSNEAGQTFTASLQQPLLQDGREIAAKGAKVEGKIVDSDKGGRVKGVASMTVQLTSLEVGGQFIYISTNSVTHNARTTKRKDAAEIGIGAGIRAAIGAIAGGGKGAAIGAGAGGAAGTGVVLATRGDPAVIPSESQLTFTLSAPVSVTIANR